MTGTFGRWIVAITFVAAAATMTAAQAVSDYTLSLPSGWEKAAFTDGAKIDRVEYVNGDRRNGLLKIKRVRLQPGESMDAVVARDSEGSHRFLPGYVAGTSERFAGGTMSGYLVQFDFSRGGAAMMGRNYYLAGRDSSVWILQFTGERASLAPIRNETDRIARTFQEK
ncbi:MAG: hypothetical protein IT175_07905 [Acidobacteria bacterium]|nr:hypothetical protein [Acidobacteriota bacterium]